jgi:peptidyl-prolyl cis-trans isomerase D
MLDVLRRNAGSWAIKFILLFIALTFIWWGVGTYTEEDRNVAATVGEETITMSELAETANNLERTYREMYGAAFTPEIAQALGLKKQAMDTLVQRRILVAEAGRMGIRATDEEVRREIAATQAFQANGQFREDLYRRVLESNRLTPPEYEAGTRTSIIIKKLEGVLAAGVLIPETKAKDLFQVSTRKIRVLVAAADPEKTLNVPPPTEEEIRSKYEQVKESFRIPARVKLAVASFTPERFGRDVDLSEEEVKAYYEGNSERYRTEEQRLVSRIVLPYTPQNRDAVRRKASDALMEATRGRAQFEAAAKKLAARKTGEEWLTRKEAGPELAGVLFSAPADTIVGPVDVKGTFVLAHVSRIRFPETLPLAQVRDRVVSQLRLEKGKDLATVKAYEAHPKAVSGKNLAKTAAEYGVKVAETGWIGAQGSPEVPAAVAQEALMTAAGEVGPVKTLGDAHHIFQVLAKEESRVPPLADVRGQIAALAARDRRAAAARAAIQQAVSASKTAAELESNARKAGLSTGPTGWFAPLAEELPGELAGMKDARKDLALLSPKAPVSPKVYSGAGGRFVAVALLEERPAGDADWAGRKDAFLNGMREQGKNSLLQAFLSDRMKEWKVEIRPEALK